MGIEFQELFSWISRRKDLRLAARRFTLAHRHSDRHLDLRARPATHDQNATGAALLAVPDPVSLSNAFSRISKKLGPAVVNISTTQVIEKPKGGKNRRKKFGKIPSTISSTVFLTRPDDAPDAERSLGSGVIVDKKGFILTNDHVIDQATKIQVTLDGDSNHYTCSRHRLRTKIPTSPSSRLKPTTICPSPSSAIPMACKWAIGCWPIGSPFGLNSTVTAGIVSAKDRSNVGHQFQRFIQTDAAINPGNSGGPLVNMAGEVIGINTAIYTGSRGFEGVGFALPSNTAINVYNQLITNGKVTRGSIGITFQEDRSNNPVLMKELGAPYGIVVEAVEPGSPADKAGLQPGDVITNVNGQPVHTGADLVNPIAETAIGQSVQVRYVRNKQTKDVALTVADRSKIFPQVAQTTGDQPDQSDTPGQFGLHVEEFTPELSRKFGMAKTTGVVVTEVEPASFAEDVDFARGDVITEINHVPISGLSDYKAAMAKLHPGEDVLFKVARRSDSDRVLTLFLAGAVPTILAQ